MKKKIILLILLFTLCACFNNDKGVELAMLDELESKTILIDYYKRIVGTEENEPYYELVLYTYNDNELLLEEYNNGGKEDEYVKGYAVDKKAYEEAIDIIIKNKMHKWNDSEDYIALDGKMLVCKYRLKDEIYRVSSGHMSNDGEKVFNDIRIFLISLKDENKLLYENYKK